VTCTRTSTVPTTGTGSSTVPQKKGKVRSPRHDLERNKRVVAVPVKWVPWLLSQGFMRVFHLANFDSGSYLLLILSITRCFASEPMFVGVKRLARSSAEIFHPSLPRTPVAPSSIMSQSRCKVSYGTQNDEDSPPLKNSPLDVETLQSRMRAVHESGVNLTYEWRMTQLRKLLLLLEEHTHEIRDAISKDLGREGIEAIVVETKPVEAEIRYMMSNLKQWMKPEAVPSPVVVIPAFSYVERRPLNSPGVLIIAPFNYPVRLMLQPLAGALAGGNPAVIKPSEETPTVAVLMKKLLEKYYTDPGVVQVVLGGPSETTALLEKKWGKVFFTGSERVGKIVARACADTLTPTVLELGGKCPVVVDETVPASSIPVVAKRLVFAKCVNAGQTCVAPDILFVHEKHISSLCTALSHELQAQFGTDPKTGELPRIVNTSHTKRLVDIIQDAEKLGSTIVNGGSQFCDVDQKYICPTFVMDPPKSARILREEVFGPVMAIVPFLNREQGIDLVKQLPGEPLQLYIFTPERAVFRKYSERCIAAGALQNDVIVQGASHTLPFGGIGTSGYGNYYGRYSFDSFTHAYPVMHRPLRGVPKILETLRTHPYAGRKGFLLEKIAFSLPDIPVLHTRWVLFALGAGTIVWASPGLQSLAKAGLIRLLECALEMLVR
jgi:acyl-CoA reductase-like NAD-dependent aldehyde dehydrogenase